jgi:hypothetical protein
MSKHGANIGRNSYPSCLQRFNRQSLNAGSNDGFQIGAALRRSAPPISPLGAGRRASGPIPKTKPRFLFGTSWSDDVEPPPLSVKISSRDGILAPADGVPPREVLSLASELTSFHKLAAFI